ncbi:MAG: hypothetical protein AAF591_04970 [Verrucomicrobiota bacterium]
MKPLPSFLALSLVLLCLSACETTPDPKVGASVSEDSLENTTDAPEETQPASTHPRDPFYDTANFKNISRRSRSAMKGPAR